MDKWIPILNTIGLAAVALITLFGNRKLHQLVNSRMSEMLVLARDASTLSRADQDARTKMAGDAEFAKGLLAGSDKVTPRREQKVLEPEEGPVPVTDERVAVAAEKNAESAARSAAATESLADTAKKNK